MEKEKFSPSSKSNHKLDFSPVKNQNEILDGNHKYEVLVNKISLLKQNLAQSIEKEQSYLQQILNLENRQQHFYEERKKKLQKLAKSKNSSQIKDLDIDVQNLISKYNDLSSQNKSLQERLKSTRIQNEKQIRESQNAVINIRKRLNEEKSSQIVCDETIQRLNNQIQQLSNKKENLEKNRIINSQNKQEIDINIEKVSSILNNRQEEMKNYQLDLKNVTMKFETLSVEKEQRLQSLKKKNKYDENQIKENIELFLNECKKYEKKIKKIKNEDIADLNFNIERASKELNHLIETHEMRKMKQIFIESASTQ